MSDKPVSNFSFSIWIISIVAMSVVYVLSYGPMYALAITGKLPNVPTPLVQDFYKLTEWVAWKLNLQNEQMRYFQWWYKRLK